MQFFKCNLIRQSNGLEFLYDHTGVFAVKYNNNTYYYRKDLQANIVSLLDNSGEVVVEYQYDAWGNCRVLNATGEEITDTTHIGILNPIRYRSYYFDAETGLYFLKTRYYDPETGRFISIDDISYLDPEIINGLNLYAYCLNNPVIYSDESGHFAITTFIISLAISSLVAWGLSEIFGAQIAGGIGAIGGGGTAISTGISLIAFGPWGIVAGVALIAVGAATAAFGTNEIVDGITGTNYIQSWTGMSDGLYNGLYTGLNIVSSIGSIAGNIGMKFASNKILNQIVKTPQNVQNYKLWQLKTYGRYSSQYIPGRLKKGEHIGQGYTLTHVNGATKGYIQWHPGSRHHFNGAPYLKVTSSLGGTWRGIYLFRRL